MVVQCNIKVITSNWLDVPVACRYQSWSGIKCYVHVETSGHFW